MEAKSNIIPMPTVETKLAQAGQDTVAEAAAMQVTDQASYEAAGAFLVGVKRMAKQVTEYWAPLKTAAKAAHQKIVDKEKAMLTPLTEAEKTVKKSMGDYQTAADAERRRIEAEARQRQQQEAERLLADAVTAEGTGDVVGAATSLAMAQMVEDMPTMTMPLGSVAPKAAGVSTRMQWEAVIVDRAKVPINHAGVELRPIDMSALNNLAKLTRGTATIPGVEFRQKPVISARA